MSQPSPEFQIIVTLLTAVNELQGRVAKLEAENKELSDRLNGNSRNSSKPPSTDGYAKPSAKEKGSSDSPPGSDPKDDKPNPKSLRQKSDQKPGGQKGHKGTTLKQTAEAEHTQYHPVIDCENCRQSLRSAKITKLMRNDIWTLYHLDPCKGHSAIESMGVLLVFSGILVHDHYKVYFRYVALHVLCNAHHLRELQGVVDRDGNYLAARLQHLLRPAWHLSKGFITIGMEVMPEPIRQRIDSLFERTAKRAMLEETEYMERRRQRLGEKKVRNTKAFNLFKRLVNFKEETLRFMTDFNIPFDNNGSEQDVRNGNVKQKISGCFRSKKKAQNGTAEYEVMFHRQGSRGKIFLKTCL